MVIAQIIMRVGTKAVRPAPITGIIRIPPTRPPTPPPPLSCPQGAVERRQCGVEIRTIPHSTAAVTRVLLPVVVPPLCFRIN